LKLVRPVTTISWGGAWMIETMLSLRQPVSSRSV